MAAQAGNGDPGDRADTQDPNGEHVRHHQEKEESKGESYTPTSRELSIYGNSRVTAPRLDVLGGTEGRDR